MTIKIDYEFNDKEVIAALKRLADSATDITSPLRAIGESLMESTKRRFEMLEDAQGNAWQANSDLTFNSDQPLTGETGSLMDTINWQMNNDSVEIGSPMEYAAMQQFGGKKSEFKHLWGDIPARPFLGISDDDEKMIIDTVHDHFGQA